MNENDWYIVKEYKFDKPLITRIDSLIDNSIRDCHDNYYHTFDHFCEYGFNFTIVTNNEIVNFTISDKSMGSYKRNKNLTVARQNGFMFNQINELTIKNYSNLSHINIHFYLKHRIPMCLRKFLLNISQNKEYIQTQCNDRWNPFHFACRKWYLYNNPQC